LNDWEGVEDLFDFNPNFLQQVYHHLSYLSNMHSRGSSANNHIIAEAAGLFVGADNFFIFEESHAWKRQAAQILDREVRAQTFCDGLNRELATGYHGLSLELLLVAAAEDSSGDPILERSVWDGITRMLDALASMVDVK